MGIVSVDLASREVAHQRGHLTRLWVGLVFGFVVTVGLLTFVLDRETGLNVKDLFLDPALKAGLGPHLGLFSHLGVLALWSGATVAFSTALLMRDAPQTGPHATRFLLSLGVLMGLLAVDDLYLLHEEVGGLLSRTLLPSIDRRLLEGLVFSVYGVAWGLWLLRYQGFIRRGPAVVLALALGGLVGSVGIDVGDVLAPGWLHASADRETAVTVLEELLKLSGLLLLAVYAITVAWERLEQETR